MFLCSFGVLAMYVLRISLLALCVFIITFDIRFCVLICVVWFVGYDWCNIGWGFASCGFCWFIDCFGCFVFSGFACVPVRCFRGFGLILRGLCTCCYLGMVACRFCFFSRVLSCWLMFGLEVVGF